ncbi:hypothetical protein FSP39_024428 [Pinctada imbricata]|uniref:Calx-beta domain-containing protein n=1 Tax=Pinctada imbricata TaxID=66713 RepID=A0AA88Y1J2_PINIB|nr:hypothetical protein FSP39_024428 [Pinctada imbricata]
MSSSCDLSSYTCSDVGMLFPIVSEYTWPIGGRAFIYLLGLLWSFMAVSIIADIFMQAIETITSKTQDIKIPDNEGGYQTVQVKLWNGTVANLTLMALGSSAPEILLTAINTIFNDFKSEALGPSCIVGSAAFNLMVITGVCVMSVPEGEVRKIGQPKVFAITAVFSVFAYIWLIIILVVITPDYVDLWEAIVTFLFFPIMVIIAYIADKDYCGKKPTDDKEALEIVHKNHVKFQFALFFNVCLISQRLRENPNAKEQDIATLTAHLMEQNKSHDRGWYRINAIRSLTGGTKLNTTLNTRAQELLEELLIEEQSGASQSFMELSEGGKKSIIEFDAPSTAVLEKDGRVRVNIMRHGNLQNKVIFKVETIDGTAEAIQDYKPLKETLVFQPDETIKHIDIEIIDDNIWEPDEVFFVRVTAEPDQMAVVGKRAITQVVILNDDEPGTLDFPKPSFLFKESVGTAMIPLQRTNGADGEISVKWKTKDITAVGGRDYKETSGTLTFEHGEITKMIEITIHNDMEFEKDENFEIDLIETTGGATIGKLKRCVVTIVNDDEFNGIVSRIADLTNANLDALRMSKQTWAKQFEEAMNVNGGDLENATVFAYVMHFFTFGFKFIFACVPPPSFLGGYLCFIVSLILIGLLTAVVSDLASIFGCLIGLEDVVTAITFVALGTSLPDLFASRQAALMEKHADSSIGNVTGSNSVNVFLGLGLAWILAASYWTAQVI